MFGINIWKQQQQNCIRKENRSRSNLGINRYLSVCSHFVFYVSYPDT